ncbi:hypothetical protein VZT92_005602 [Zoarces viviparus]|uniref:Uncharacterized protein n=1 Tax=Zoarces viviparus TaxID=48416 RepID=A0AAW1FTK5_ZOAVI
MADVEISHTFCWLQTPHICAAPLSVSHTAAAEAGEASAQCLPAPVGWESPGEAADWHPDCQPNDGSYQENQT